MRTVTLAEIRLSTHSAQATINVMFSAWCGLKTFALD
jgi:hypothetical protein